MKRWLVIGLFACSTNLYATNGYFSHGLGTKSKGMAGAGVALAEDALGGALNPANMALIGSRMDLGGSLFIPKRGFRANNDGTPPWPQVTPSDYKSKNDFFVIPQFAYNHQIDHVSTIGIALTANGLSTKYGSPLFDYFNPFVSSSTPAGADLYQLLLHVPYSRRLTDDLAIGVAPIFAVQTFRARGLEDFKGVSIYPNEVTNNGFDFSYGVGANLGINYRVTDRLSLGVGAQSRIYMTEFDSYRGLFAEQGDFDIPESVQLGFALQATDNLILAVDYQRIYYSHIASVANPNDIPLNPLNPTLGSDNGAGGGWQDAKVIKVGIRWEMSPQTILRAGYSRSTQVIPNTQALVNIFAPAVGTEHFSIGMTKALTKDRELNIALTHSPRQELTGNNPNTSTQTGTLRMQQTELEITYSWKL